MRLLFWTSNAALGESCSFCVFIPFGSSDQGGGTGRSLKLDRLRLNSASIRDRRLKIAGLDSARFRGRLRIWIRGIALSSPYPKARAMSILRSPPRWSLIHTWGSSIWYVGPVRFRVAFQAQVGGIGGYAERTLGFGHFHALTLPLGQRPRKQASLGQSEELAAPQVNCTNRFKPHRGVATVPGLAVNPRRNARQS